MTATPTDSRTIDAYTVAGQAVALHCLGHRLIHLQTDPPEVIVVSSDASRPLLEMRMDCAAIVTQTIFNLLDGIPREQQHARVRNMPSAWSRPMIALLDGSKHRTMIGVLAENLLKTNAFHGPPLARLLDAKGIVAISDSAFQLPESSPVADLIGHFAHWEESTADIMGVIDPVAESLFDVAKDFDPETRAEYRSMLPSIESCRRRLLTSAASLGRLANTLKEASDV